MEVEIFGNKYTLKGDIDPVHIKNLSEYVDKKMRDVSKQTSTISSLKVAVLAALHIADDFFMLKEGYEKKIGRINKKADTLSGMIEKELNC